MPESLRDELEKVFRLIVIHSAAAFSFGDQVVTVQTPGWPQSPFHPNWSGNDLTSHLQSLIYQNCYIRKSNGCPTAAHDAAIDDDHAFLKALSAANTSRQLWDYGWRIEQIHGNGQIEAQKNGLSRLVWPGEFVLQDGIGLAPQPGAQIGVHLASESVHHQNGFYYAFGETPSDHHISTFLVRFYWNVNADGAPLLLQDITHTLNRFQIPFSFKCLSNPAMYHRIDAAVLFVEKRFYRIVAHVLGPVYRQITPHLKPETLLFSKRLADGLSLAEEPGNGESFGMNRCRITAEGVVAAYLQHGLQTPAARWQMVTDRFNEYGLAISKPYLNPGSPHDYTFPGSQDESQ